MKEIQNTGHSQEFPVINTEPKYKTRSEQEKKEARRMQQGRRCCKEIQILMRDIEQLEASKDVQLQRCRKETQIQIRDKEQ